MLSTLHSVRLQVLDDNGDPLVGGKVYSYELGTTTPKPTYVDIFGNSVNTNPIILDMAGTAETYTNGSYTFYTTDANDVPISNPTMDIRGNSLDSISSSGPGTFASNEVVVVSNYAAVRAINSPYAVVFCQGRETQNDGAEGWFVLDISSLESDDDCVILKPNTTGVYRRYNVQVIDPRWAGVVYDTIVSQAIYLSAASTASIRHAKPLEIAGSIYINSNFQTSAEIEFTNNGSLVSTLPITASFYNTVKGSDECFKKTVQPKFYKIDEVFYSWFYEDNVEGRVSKLINCTTQECIINFDKDISTTSPIILPSNYTFKSNNTITFATTSPMDLTIPKIDKVYDDVFKFQALSTVGVITISEQITPEFFGAVGSGDDSISVLAALKAGNVKLTQSLSSTAANLTTNPINIISDNINKSTMPKLTLNSLAFSSLILKNVALAGSLNGTSLDANNSKFFSVDGTVNTVILNDVEYVAGKISCVDSELDNVTYSGSTIPCSKISKLTNSQFTNCKMSGSDKIEGIISNVIITPTSANSIILKNSTVQNLYYNDSSDTFKPVLVLSGNNTISNSNFTTKNYKMLCKGNSSSATFNSCTFSDKITVSEAQNVYKLNGCEGGSLEVNGVRNSIDYRTKIFTSGCLTSSVDDWTFKNSGEIDDLDVIDVSLNGDYFTFNQAYYFDWVYSENSVINGNSADTDQVYTYTYIPENLDSFDKFVRFGGRLRVTTKNAGNSYFKICMMDPNYKISKGGVEVNLTTSANSVWSGLSDKLLHQTNIISNDSSDYVTTEFSYEVNHYSFRPVLEDFAVPNGYPVLLTDHLGIRTDTLNNSATTQNYTNAEICFVGFVDAGTEVKIEWVAEIPKTTEISETYFKKTSASSDSYYIANEDYFGSPYLCSGVNNVSRKWIFDVEYSEVGEKILMTGKNPTLMTSVNSLSAGNYPLIRNGYNGYLDYWKFMRNEYVTRLDNILPKIVENDVEIVLENIVDKDNLSNFPERIIKPFSALRFYKILQTLE